MSMRLKMGAVAKPIATKNINSQNGDRRMRGNAPQNCVHAAVQLSVTSAKERDSLFTGDLLAIVFPVCLKDCGECGDRLYSFDRVPVREEHRRSSHPGR